MASVAAVQAQLFTGRDMVSEVLRKKVAPYGWNIKLARIPEISSLGARILVRLDKQEGGKRLIERFELPGNLSPVDTSRLLLTQMKLRGCLSTSRQNA
jgi:hypothetical protein